MTCKIDGCDRPVRYVGLGVCQKHYFRFRRNGHFETAKVRQAVIQNPDGYRLVWDPSNPLAHVSGYVYEHRKIIFAKYGYNLPPCEICGAPTNWETCHIDHVDENPSNNAPDNLRPLCPGCNTWRSMPPMHTFERCSAITIDGVTQTAHEWSRDPRVKVSSRQILHRKRKGASDYDAVFGEKKTHNGRKPVRPPRPPASSRKNSINATIGGITKTAMEWARAEDCTVSDGTIRARIKDGWPHEQAVFAPAKWKEVQGLRGGE